MTSAAYSVEQREWSAVDAALRADLLALNLASARPIPFFTPEYLDAYLASNERYPTADMSPFVLLIHDRGELVGALPLKSVRHIGDRPAYRQVEFMAATEIDVPCVIATPEHAAGVATAIFDHLPRLLRSASAVHLTHLAVDGPLFGSRHQGRRWWSRVHDDPGMPISSIEIIDPTSAEYFKRMSKRMRSNVSRLIRRLAGQGALEYVSTSDPAVLPQMFEIYLDIEDRSWKRGTDAGVRRHPRRVGMYEQLHARVEHVTHSIDVLVLDGEPIAGLMSMSFGPTHFLMETCYDESHADLSPSMLLLFMAIDRAIREGATEVSLHGHFDYYKHRWLAESHPTNEVRLLRRGSVPDVRAAGSTLVRRLRHVERSTVEPEGNLERTNVSPMPACAVGDQMAAVRTRPGVTVLDVEALDAFVPFQLTSGT